MDMLEPSELQALKNNSIRKFKVPKVNFRAKTYPKLFDWNVVPFSEPPLMVSLTDEQLKDIAVQRFNPPKYACHTQAVERAVKLVTEAANSVVGEEARDGFIRKRIRSRKEVGRFDTKTNFLPKIENS